MKHGRMQMEWWSVTCSDIVKLKWNSEMKHKMFKYNNSTVE